MANKPRQRNRPEPYAVFVDDPRKSPSFFKGSFPSLTGALNRLKVLRCKDFGQSSVIYPANATERANFPYCNRIGPVRDGSDNRWGYKYREPGTGVVITIFIEKRADGPGWSSLKEDLESQRMAEEVRKMEIRY